MRQKPIKRWTPVNSWDELPQVMGVEDLCKVLRISKNTALKYLSDGRIAAIKMDRAWRIDKDAVKAYLRGERGDVA